MTHIHKDVRGWRVVLPDGRRALFSFKTLGDKAIECARSFRDREWQKAKPKIIKLTPINESK